MSETIQTKRCSHCKQIKVIAEFPKDRNRPGGHAYQCKSCRKAYMTLYLKSEKGKNTRKNYEGSPNGKVAIKRYRQSEKGKVASRKRIKKYHQTEKGKNTLLKARKKYAQSEKGKVYYKQWYLKHPEIRKAKSAIDWAVRTGKLPKVDSLKCACGKQAVEYHHHKGYSSKNWLDVIPVCKKCHSEHHLMKSARRVENME